MKPGKKGQVEFIVIVALIIISGSTGKRNRGFPQNGNVKMKEYVIMTIAGHVSCHAHLRNEQKNNSKIGVQTSNITTSPMDHPGSKK